MQIPRSLINELNADIKALSESAQAAAGVTLASVFAEWDGTNIAALRNACISVLDTIASAYTDYSAARAATFYDDVRALQVASSSYQAAVNSMRAPAATAGAVRAFIQKIVDGGNSSEFIETCQERLDYEIELAANMCLADNSARDPLKPKYARVPSGDTCEWCLMLASNGFYYNTAEAASHSHSNCDCRVVPGFEGTTVEGYDPNEIYKQWKQAVKDRESRQAARETLDSQELDDLIAEYGLKKRDVVNTAVSQNIDTSSTAAMKRLMESMYVDGVISGDDEFMTKGELAAVTSAINTVFNARFEGKEDGVFAFGDYLYELTINDFNDYTFLDKTPLE